MYSTAPSRLSCRAMYGTAPSRVCLVVHTSGQAKLVLSRYRTHARGSVVNIHTTPNTKRVLVTGTQTRSLFRRVRVRPRPVAGAGVSSPARPPDACGGCGVAQWHPASRPAPHARRCVVGPHSRDGRCALRGRAVARCGLLGRRSGVRVRGDRAGTSRQTAAVQGAGRV